MSKLKSISSILIALTASFSCNPIADKDILLSFANEQLLSNGEMIMESGSLDPIRIEVFDSLIILASSNSDSYLLCYDTKTKKQLQWLRQGKGANEILNFTHMQKFNDSVLQVDGAPNTVHLYNINNIAQNINNPKVIHYTQEAFNNVIVLDTSKIMYSGKNTIDNNCNTRFCIENIRDSSITYWGDFPAGDENLINLPSADFSQLTAYQGFIKANRSINKAVMYYFYAVGFDIIDLEKLNIDNLYYQYPGVICKRNENLGANFISRNDDKKRGFIDAWCDDKAIYFLYSDKNFSDPTYSVGKYILKYDWSGKPLVKYILDIEAQTFSIYMDYLYAVCVQNDSIKIVRYRLD